MFRMGQLSAADAARLNELDSQVKRLLQMTAAAPLSLDKSSGVPAFSINGGPVSPWKATVRAASTANVTLATGVEAGDTLDGVTLVVGDRILLKDQTAGAENGIYTVSATGSPNRTTDADDGDDLVGATVWVSEGTANGNTIWACTTDAAITVDTTALVWAQVYPDTSGTPTHWKLPCRVMATASVTIATALEDGDTLNGVTLATGDRVLLVFQSNPAYNGIYVVQASGTALRADDADTSDDLSGCGVVVMEGTTYAGSAWCCTSPLPFTIDDVSSDVSWRRLDSPTTTKGDIIAHNGTDDVRLAVGTSGYVLVADGSAAEGVKWEEPSAIVIAGAAPSWVKYTKTYADFSTAATFGTFLIFNLPAGNVIHAVVAKTTTAFDDPTSNFSYGMTIGVSGATSRYMASYATMAAFYPVSGTNFAPAPSSPGTMRPPPEDFGGTTAINAYITANVNLDTYTQGVVDIWFLISALP